MYKRQLLIDANRPEDPGAVSEETRRWIVTQLEKAQADQQIVFSLSHQNLADHTAMFSSGFTARGAESVRALLSTYDVRVNFSGHMHIQHIQKQDGLTDIATSSLSVTPLHYGVITLDEDRTLHYQIESLADPDLQSQAKLCFDQITRRQTQRALETLELSPQEKAAMVELAVAMNDEIFDGTLAQNAERIRQEMCIRDRNGCQLRLQSPEYDHGFLSATEFPAAKKRRGPQCFRSADQ